MGVGRVGRGCTCAWCQWQQSLTCRGNNGTSTSTRTTSHRSIGKFSLTSIFYNVVRTDRVGDASVSRARVEVRACMSEQCYCAVKLMLSIVFTPHPFSVSLSSPHHLPLEEVLRCLRLCCCFALYDLIMPNVDAIAASERGRVDLVALIEASGAHAVANLLQRLNHLRVNPSLMEMVRSRSYAAALWNCD